MKDLNLFLVLYPLLAGISIIGIIKNKEKIGYYIEAVLLLIISMLRFDFQYDYFWYWIVGNRELKYNNIVQFLYNNLEYGVAKIYDFVRWLGHPQYFFVITSLIIMGLILITLHRDSRNPLIGLSLFILIPTGLLANSEFIMQSLAGGIIFISTKYIYEKKYIKFIIIVLLVSFLFHTSAIVCLCFLFIPRRNIKVMWFILGGVLSGIILKNILPIIVEKYFSNYYYLLYGVKYLKNSNLYNLKILGLFLIFILIIDKINIKNITNRCFKITGYEIYQKNIFVVGYILSLLVYYIFEGDLSRRIGIYFYYFSFLIAGNYIEKLNLRISKLVKILIIIVCLLQEITSVYKNDLIYLDKTPHIDKNGNYNARPNSNGLRLFFGKRYEDMSPYLPGEIRFEKQQTLKENSDL